MNRYQSSMYLPPFRGYTRLLVIISAGAFLLQSIWTVVFKLPWPLPLIPAMVSSGHVYQLLTYPLAGNGLIDILFNALIIWFIGAELECLWGQRKYLTFVFGSVIGGGFIYLLLALLFPSVGGLPLTGLMGPTNALLIAYALIYPNQVFSFMLLFPMKAKYFCMVLLAMQLYMGFFSPGGVMIWGHLGGMAVGVLIALWGTGKLHLQILSTPAKKKGRASLHLVDTSKEKEPPKYWH